MQKYTDTDYTVVVARVTACLIAGQLLCGCGSGSTDAQTSTGSVPASLAMQNLATGPGNQLASLVSQDHEDWRKAMLKTPLPKKGCFHTAHPSTSWIEAQCVAAPNVPYLPAKGTKPQTVGNGTDFSAQVVGAMNYARGSILTTTNVTSETDGTANNYSLQLNTNFFTTSACNGHTGCQGWQQFLYVNGGTGTVFMQYWLLGYGSPCPAGWNTFAGSCWKNSAGHAVALQPITNLANMRLTGAATAGGTDTAMIDTGDAGIVATAQDSVLNLGQAAGWNTVEYNVVGNGNGSAAVFNSGATMLVDITVQPTDGSLAAPGCVSTGFTGETNNLNLVPSSCCPNAGRAGGVSPYIRFTQTNAANVPAPFCLQNDIEAILYPIQ